MGGPLDPSELTDMTKFTQTAGAEGVKPERIGDIEQKTSFYRQFHMKSSL